MMPHRKLQYPHKKRSRWYVLQMTVIFFLVTGIFALSAFLIWAATIQIPDFSLFEQIKVSQSTKIFDRTGTILLYDVHKDIRRTVVPFDKINPYIKNATVAIEDDQFYQHFGIKPTAILRAMLANLKSGGYGQGGSTITQQIVKNSLLGNEKTITRKIKEWILAIRLERILNKEQILSLYLNEMPYGGQIYGVEEASQEYFGVPANNVDLAQAAYIAALPQSPTVYSPYGSHVKLLEDRKNAVLKKMLALGMISKDEYASSTKEKVKFLPQEAGGIRAPHFVMYIRQQLAEQYGEDALNEGGMRVITSINMDMQSKAEEIVKKYAAQNEKTFNAKNAALVAIDPKTGEILTMVGSRDYFDTAHEGNFNVALANRQPGSSFKPFVYAAAFEKGYTPDTVLFDLPTEFSARCDPSGKPNPGVNESSCYMPEDYDHMYRGPMTLRNAIAQSVNVPSVKLLYLVGIDKALEFAERLGITTLGSKAQYGLTLVLGGGEVSLLEMTSAYSVFANEGKRNPYTGILRVDDKDGNTIFKSNPKDDPVIDPEIARKISNVLDDNNARAPAFGSQSYLYFPNHEVAVKTGTTNDYRDAWIIGYTPSLAVGAWAGNNDNTPMEKKVAGFIIAPMWNAFVSEALKNYPVETFPDPQPIPSDIKPVLRGIWYGGNTVPVDKVSGKRATTFTPPELIEYRVIPDPHEILFWVNKNDPLGSAPLNPASDPQYLNWETPVQNWIAQNGIPGNLGTIPEASDDVHTPQNVPQIDFIDPNTTTLYQNSEKLLIQPQIHTNYPVAHVDYYINGFLYGSVQNPPFAFAFVPKETPGIMATNTARVVVVDTMGNNNEKTVQFTVVQ